MKRDDLSNRGRRFRIWVQGRLNEGFAEGLDGIEQTDTGGGSTLSGDFIDRSHLYGILDHLRGLGVDILRFEVDPPPRNEPSPDNRQPGSPHDP